MPSEQKLIDSLKRAFKDCDHKTFIIFDGQTMRSDFLRAAWNLAIDRGWIESRPYDEEQYSAYHGYLTPKGRKELLDAR